MDAHKPFITVSLEPFIFCANRYEEYEDGQLKASGNTSVEVVVRNQLDGQIQCLLGNNDLCTKLMSTKFDLCISLNDRLLMMSSPEYTNANILVVAMLQNLVGNTCLERNYESIEPVVGSIYTEQGVVVKVSFTMANPERLIELY